MDRYPGRQFLLISVAACGTQRLKTSIESPLNARSTIMFDPSEERNAKQQNRNRNCLRTRVFESA